MGDDKHLFASCGDAADFEHKLSARGVNEFMMRQAKDSKIVLDLLARVFKEAGSIRLVEARDLLSVEMPSTTKMMHLTDHEFIMVYVAHMASYDLPRDCSHPGCGIVIYNPIDLRRHYGIDYCPAHYVEAVETDRKVRHKTQGSMTSYMQRVARLLPSRMLSKQSDAA